MSRSKEATDPSGALHRELPRRRILLADDDADVQRAVGRLAKGNDYDFVRVTAGVDVVRRAVETTPDLIVLDVSFPDADGRDILALLKTNPATQAIPVLVWSGRSTDRESDRRISLSLGAEDYVEKADIVTLLSKIRRLLFRLDSARGVTELAC